MGNAADEAEPQARFVRDVMVICVVANRDEVLDSSSIDSVVYRASNPISKGG
jgi:hypothetical protein